MGNRIERTSPQPLSDGEGLNKDRWEGMTLDELLTDSLTLVVINHSGGKDSQAMYLAVKDLVPKERLVIIHANLPEVEWEGIHEHILDTTSHELFIVQANKTFFEMVEHRQKFPSPANRQCTSDLKRHPINKQIIALCNQRGFKRVLNCMGLRAEESYGRAKKVDFRLVPSNTNGKRDWYEWLPIHSLTTVEVFQKIAESRQKPHWAYGEGMKRLSCCFCIMSCKEDILTAKRLKPELFKRYALKERELNFTMSMPFNGVRKFLDEID